MKRWYVAAAAAVWLLGPGSSSFAKDAEIILSLVDGKVLIDSGSGLEPSLAGKQLSPDNQIIVGSDSQAEILFTASGCTLKILPSSVVTVPAVPPCPPGEAWATATPVFAQPTADVPADPSVGGVADPGIGPALVAGGIAAVAIGAVILLTNDDNGNGIPVSRP